MLLIYSNTITERLTYTCSFIFKELMCTPFSITTDVENFKKFVGAKINYSHQEISNSIFQIPNHSLLFENDIKNQLINCFKKNEYTAFFKTENASFPFDIFAATFYLLTRYEEYLPHTKDMYGRYAHENSIAFKEGFLNLPLINIWVKDFADAIQKQCIDFNCTFPDFKFIPTYDIDMAYAYKGKGFWRNAGGAIKSFFKFDIGTLVERINVLWGNKKDPFDTFSTLDALHAQYSLRPFYFFLVAAKNGVYDKNILPQKKSLQLLIKSCAKNYAIGLHPSWQSGDDVLLLQKEKKHLETIGEMSIVDSRQHYIRFNLPEGYRRLIEAKIENDYSMGYGSINGFRASVASSFLWFDLQTNKQTALRIHPFCFMEANSYYEQKLSVDAAFDEIISYYNICKKVNGTCITIWHNHFLGSSKMYKGWPEMYKRFLNAIV